MQPQDDAIVGGTALRIPAIQSPNFSAGSLGWIIRADGSAEFNGATFRGNVVIQSNQAVLFYSATPAAGNLVGSISPVGGTDGFGNTYPAGFQFLDGTLKSALTVTTFLGTLVPIMQLFTGAPDEDLPFHIIVGAAASNGPYIAQIVGPANSGVQDAVGIQLISGDNATADAFGQMFYDTAFVTGTGTRTFMIQWGVFGVNLSPVGSLVSLQPGTGTSIANPPVAESWHAIPLNPGFAALGLGFQSPRYQIETMNGKRIRLDGTLKLTANQAQGTTFATLSATGYQPTATKLYLTPNNLSGATGQVESLNVANNGDLNLGHSGTNGNYLSLDGVTIPVD